MNRSSLAAPFVATLALLATTMGAPVPDASACAVLTPDETTPVVGHKMILSLTNDQTTLWDQFVYTGDPASFGWILPTKGLVEVGVSSDALFDALGQLTAPKIFAPSICPNSCNGQGGGFGGTDGVTVIAHEFVGQYETVQLSSSDPNALKDWLAANGYPIPAGIGPVLDAYVAEGFDFLAVKLTPGAAADAIVPLRITTPGAAPSIPLRLLQAGTGDITQVTLFVVSEGRYEPANAPVLSIQNDDLTWDFATDSSNYLSVKTQLLADSNGLGWLLEQARPYEKYEIEDPLAYLVSSDPDGSGYDADPMIEPDVALANDLDALMGPIAGDIWVTRLTADLSREALETDLALGASPDQTAEYGELYPTNYVNESQCPPDPCAGEGGAGGGGAPGTGGSPGTGGNPGEGGNDGGGGNGNNTIGGGGDCGCRAAGAETRDLSGAAWMLVGLAGLLPLRRRRR